LSVSSENGTGSDVVFRTWSATACDVATCCSVFMSGAIGGVKRLRGFCTGWTRISAVAR
jgi:hypothetical protein